MSFVNQMYIDLLKQASEDLSNNSCNDFDVTVTDENRQELRLFISDYASDLDELRHLKKQLDEGRIYFQDFSIMDMLIKQLENKA